MIKWIVILSLVTWRLSSLLYVESLFEWLRNRFGVYDDEDTGARSIPDGIIGKLFDCFWCMVLAVGIIFMVPVYILTDFNMFEIILLWLASSAGALIIDVRYFARLRS